MDISNNTVRYQTIPTKNVVLETPLEITVTHKINSYIYYVQNLELNNFVIICVIFYSDTSEKVGQCHLNVYKELYDKWADDDDYIRQLLNYNIEHLYKSQAGRIPFLCNALPLPN